MIALSFLLLAQLINQPWGDKNRQEVARFGKIENCRWTNQEKIPLSGDPVTEGQRIEISSGKVELLYHNGARIELTGPCIIETISEKETFLTMGTVDVVADSPESQGFMVRSPTSIFEDLGTAFSASVAPDGLSRLEVSDGEVNLIVEQDHQHQLLQAGQTMLVEPGERRFSPGSNQGMNPRISVSPRLCHQATRTMRTYPRALLRPVWAEVCSDRGQTGQSIQSPFSMGVDKPARTHPRNLFFLRMM